MADDTAGNFGIGTTVQGTAVRPDLADKYLYFYKLDTWNASLKARMLGLQGATSGTNTKTVTTTATKTVAIKTDGSPTQQRTVLAYFQVGDGIYEDLKKAWRFGITIHLYRLNLNQISGTKPARTAPCEYSQVLLGVLPMTENLGGIMQASCAFEVQGLAQEADITEDQFENAAFDLGQDLYDFIKPTEAGGSTDQGYVNANAAQPTADETDKYMKTDLNGSTLDFGTGSDSSSTSGTSSSTTGSDSSAGSGAV